MKYKDFIAMAATKIVAQKIVDIKTKEILKTELDGNIIGINDKVKEIIVSSVNVAKALAEELEVDFVWEDELVDNHKMKKDEYFFDYYDIL